MPAAILLTTDIRFLLLILSQISSISTDSSSLLRRKDMQIVDILQSTFTNTTNVLFLVDNRENLIASTSAVLELALKLFSHQKTFQLLALNNFLDRIESKTTSKKSKEISKIDKVLTSKKTLATSIAAVVRMQSVANDPRSPFQNSPAELDKGAAQVHKGGKQTNRNPSLLSQLSELPKKFKLSATTSIVIFLSNLSALSVIDEFSINTPKTSKIVFLYDECMAREEAATTAIAHFSENIWMKFRILFTYFILFCPSRHLDDKLNSRSIDRRKEDENMAALNETDTPWNRFNNRIGTFENKNIIQSLYVYNPYFRSVIPKEKTTACGEICKINLDEDESTIAGQLRQTTGTIFNGNGHHLRVVAFTSPNTIKKSDFSFLSRHLDPQLLKNPFSSLDAFVGVEILILRELARRMNFKIQLVPVSDQNAYGWKHTNGTFLGTLGDLIYRRADITLNGFFIKDYETEQLLFTTSIQDDKICVAVQTPALIPNSILLYKVFTPYVWLLLMLTFIVASLLYSTVLYLVKENKLMKLMESPLTPRRKGLHKQLESSVQLPFKSSNRPYNRISAIVSQCTRIIAVLLNASLSHSFNSSTYERIFVVLCLLLGLILTGSFQGSLMDIYTTPREFPSIDTLEQLDKTGMLIILEHAGLQTDIFGTEPPGSILGNLRKKIKVTGVADDILLSEIGAGKKFAALLRLGDFDRIKFKIPYRSDGKTLIHVIPDCPKTYNLAFLVNKSSEFYATINYYLGRIAAGGLLNKWIRDSVDMFRLHSNLKNRNLIKDSKIILTISHLQVAFFVLFMGLVVSIGLLLIEVCWEWRRTKRKVVGNKDNRIKLKRVLSI